MLLEELLVEIETVFGGRWQVVPVDHVVMAVHVDIEDLMDENQADHHDEVDWVDHLVAILHEEGGDEQAEGDQVHTHTEDFVEKAKLAAAGRGQLLVGEHGIDNDAESKEEGVLGEEQNDKDAIDVSVGELIHQQVDDDQELATKQALHFSEAGRQLVVVLDANDHVDCHHSGLDHNPALLDPVGDGGVVVLLVEVIRLDPVVSGNNVCHTFKVVVSIKRCLRFYGCARSFSLQMKMID